MKFKTGDRIRVYGAYRAVAGPGSFFGGSHASQPFIVTRTFDFEVVQFKDDVGCEYDAHPKQCRRLKKPREIWVERSPNTADIHSNLGSLQLKLGEKIRFVEARKK